MGGGVCFSETIHNHSRTLVISAAMIHSMKTALKVALNGLFAVNS